jgi:putative tryptophan/tyrosine transport system substrate-binding protein
VAAAQVRDTSDLDGVISTYTSNGALIVPPDTFTVVHRALIIALAAEHRVPVVCPFRYFAIEGGLMVYGIDTLDLYRRGASYVDRILRGIKPADLPVQQPTKFEFLINLRTAKALGLTVPDRLLVTADEVIE